MRLVQLGHPEFGRSVALVDEPNLELLTAFTSIYDLANRALDEGGNISDLVGNNLSGTILDYNSIYDGTSAWQLLPSFDHPKDPQILMLSGTGLTHKASAENRQAMHQAKMEGELSDSMKMYLMGVEGGHPKKHEIGVQPEWFYKGNGSVVRAHGQRLQIPLYGNDGGEEPEIAGVYIVDANGIPCRIGFTTANEFSDHIMERKNYLYLAPSKIRNCAIGPELVITSDFESVSGKVCLYREGKILWERHINTGELHMAHSLLNLEYHHFKYENHRLPGQTHIHFFGADAFSFGAGITLQDNDIMQIAWDGMGRPLRNVLVNDLEKERPLAMNVLK